MSLKRPVPAGPNGLAYPQRPHDEVGGGRETTTSIVVERYADCPFSVAGDYAAEYLRRAEAGGSESVVRASIFGAAAIIPRRKVALTFGLRRDDDEPGRSHDEISIFWDARSWMFPNFTGSIRLRIAAPGTRLTLSGSYHPPFGFAGRIFDDLFGRHIAAATMHDYLDRLATDLEARESAYRANAAELLEHSGVH